jgi:hypothetical protein
MVTGYFGASGRRVPLPVTVESGIGPEPAATRILLLERLIASALITNPPHAARELCVKASIRPRSDYKTAFRL